MNNFVEELKKYFESNPKEKILEDWAKSAEYDNIGPTVQDFLVSTHKYCVQTYDPSIRFKDITTQTTNPKYTSGFLLNNNSYKNAKGSLFDY